MSVHGLVGAARSQISAYLERRLKAKLPADGRATLNDVRRVVDELCLEFDQPGTIRVEVGDDGHVKFILSDPVRTMLLAAGIHAREKQEP